MQANGCGGKKRLPQPQNPCYLHPSITQRHAGSGLELLKPPVFSGNSCSAFTVFLPSGRPLVSASYRFLDGLRKARLISLPDQLACGIIQTTVGEFFSMPSDDAQKINQTINIGGRRQLDNRAYLLSPYHICIVADIWRRDDRQTAREIFSKFRGGTHTIQYVVVTEQKTYVSRNEMVMYILLFEPPENGTALINAVGSQGTAK